MNQLAVLVPVAARPHRVKPLLDSLAAATTVPYRVLFIADPEDALEHEAIRREEAELWAFGGNYAAKINHGCDVTDEPLIFLGADDLHFHPGWFEAAEAKLTDGIGVVSTNDLCNARNAAGNLATHALVTRWYVDRHGTIDEPGKALHEGYLHEFVDQELTETAKHRGMFAHAPDSVVEHLHPDAKKAPMDPLYAQRPGRMRYGRRLFRHREHLWTG